MRNTKRNGVSTERKTGYYYSSTKGNARAESWTSGDNYLVK